MTGVLLRTQAVLWVKAVPQLQQYKTPETGADTAPLLLLHHRPGRLFREKAFKKKLLGGGKRKKGMEEEVCQCLRVVL